MCLSKRDGGVRCFDHAMKRLEQTQEELKKNPDDLLRRAYVKDAKDDLMRTKRFRRELEQRIADPNTSPTAAVAVRRKLDRLNSSHKNTVMQGVVQYVIGLDPVDARTSSYMFRTMKQGWKRAVEEHYPTLRLSEKSLMAWAKSDNLDAVRAVSLNPVMTARVATFLSTHEDRFVRNGVAMHPNTPVEVLRLLATDSEWNVRSYTAMNPNCPPDVLASLATDEKPNVREAVAGNSNTPKTVLAALYVNNKGIRMKRALASNPSSPVKVLNELMKHRDPTVQENLRETVKAIKSKP